MSCLSLYHDMTVQCVCNHGIRFPGRFFHYLDSDSEFLPRFSSCAMTTQLYQMFVKALTTSSSMSQATKLKSCTQQLKHEKYRNQANQEQPQPFFMMSPSDLPATPSSECLQERCSRHRHWETYDNKTNLKQPKFADKTVSTASLGVSRPLLKLQSDACAQPCRHFWKQQVNLELTKSTILLSLDQANSSAFGTLLRDGYQGYTLR